MTRPRALSRFAPSAIFLLTLALLAASFSIPVAETSAPQEPASEGRPITPAGKLLMDLTTRQPAVGALPVNFVRSPDHSAADGGGRYLISVNSGFGLQFNAASNRAQQSLSVIDLMARPAPSVVQNVFFPTPQSVNVGVIFAPQPEDDGSYALYASGGVENKIWVFRFRPGLPQPLSPSATLPNANVEAPFIDVNGFATSAPSPRYNSNRAPVYPTGLAISSDGNNLFLANNLGDSLGIVSDLRGSRKLERVDLSGQKGARAEGEEHFVYPYDVIAVPPGPLTGRNDPYANLRGDTAAVYVSCWNDDSVALIDFAHNGRKVSYIPVGHHPTKMLWDGTRSRLYVVNSNADSVSMIDTRSQREVERINVRLAEDAQLGSSPEGLALNSDGTKLYVANAHSNALAVIALSPTSLDNSGSNERPAYLKRKPDDRSRVLGFIPTGQYPSAVAVVNQTIFVGNGKGTGFENSSLVVNNSGRVPNAPNDRFPKGVGRGSGAGGEYSVALVAGNISAITVPDERALANYTQQVMRNDGLLGARRARLFPGASPIKHVIYIIKENRSYDQVFGDIEKSGDGSKADGDATLAIFGAGEAARLPGGAAQDITPNHHALALRFGLLDRFFVNSEASPDGHNWSTAAFSTDYIDKAYRWEYGGRGRTYDYEGFNRLPNIGPVKDAPPFFRKDVGADEIADFMRRFIPYLSGSRDAGEPETLYLWDAAARAGLSYRNYGEFVATLSEADVSEVNQNRSKPYPDLSQTVKAFPTKKSLEGHYSAAFRNFDLSTPDAMTLESYRAAKESGGSIDPAVNGTHADKRFRGVSRLSAWLDEFHEYAADRDAGRADHLPNLSVLRFSSDHTDGLLRGKPTPQFYVADNDYAVGRLVEAVSNGPYWKDTAIIAVEDDAQDGPDHVDAHRSVALVISAYNRPGALVHEFHNTVSLIRTIELLLGLEPMNQLDATANPIDIFRNAPDLRPYKALLPTVALDNLITPPPHDATTAYWMRRSAEQEMEHADLADAGLLNQIIWFSVRKNSERMPLVAHLPAFDLMRLGLAEKQEDEEALQGKPNQTATSSIRTSLSSTACTCFDLSCKADYFPYRNCRNKKHETFLPAILPNHY